MNGLNNWINNSTTYFISHSEPVHLFAAKKESVLRGMIFEREQWIEYMDSRSQKSPGKSKHDEVIEG